MPAQPKEKRIQIEIQNALAAVGQGADPENDWLTRPEFEVIGALKQITASPSSRILLRYTRTSPSPSDGGLSTHSFRAFWDVYLVSANKGNAAVTANEVLQLKADALRSLFAAEGAITEAGATGGVWPGTHEMHPELAPAGAALGLLEIFTDFTIEHTDT